ncbi:hypothetical protein Tco_1402562 [Tanacetum coccineum]
MWLLLSGSASDQSSSTQPKATTSKKLRKKQNLPSFEPKTSTYVRRPKQKKTITETQHDEESRATAQITKGLDASNPAEEVANQPETASIEKVNENVKEDPMATDAGIMSHPPRHTQEEQGEKFIESVIA